MLAWNDVKDEFAWEGSLRDICVPETTIADWQAIWSLLRRLHVRYAVDDVATTPPNDVRQIFAQPRECTHLLAIRVADAQLICHFFDESEIELDLDPRRISDQGQLDALISFMADLAIATGRVVLLTPENMHDSPFLCVPPSTTVEYIPTGGFFREAAEQHAEAHRLAVARRERSS